MTIKQRKKRINITADSDVEAALVSAAERDGMLVTTKAEDLLRLALELEEDLALTRVAEARSRGSAQFISHEKAWGK